MDKDRFQSRHFLGRGGSSRDSLLTKAVPIETVSVDEDRFQSRHFLDRGGSNRDIFLNKGGSNRDSFCGQRPVPIETLFGPRRFQSRQCLNEGGSNRDTFWTEAVPIETTFEQRRFQSRQFLWTRTGSNRDSFWDEAVSAETVSVSKGNALRSPLEFRAEPHTYKRIPSGAALGSESVFEGTASVSQRLTPFWLEPFLARFLASLRFVRALPPLPPWHRPL